tara:strand:+ start:396 stop:563 length:168 start_codon:yes stop_codon:yes gene_type:complete
MRDRHRQLTDFQKKSEHKKKELHLSKNLKKEVETGAHGTQKYTIKEGVNKGKVVG